MMTGKAWTLFLLVVGPAAALQVRPAVAGARGVSTCTGVRMPAPQMVEKSPRDALNNALDNYENTFATESSRRTVIGSFVGALTGVTISKIIPAKKAPTQTDPAPTDAPAAVPETLVANVAEPVKEETPSTPIAAVTPEAPPVKERAEGQLRSGNSILPDLSGLRAVAQATVTTPAIHFGPLNLPAAKVPTVAGALAMTSVGALVLGRVLDEKPEKVNPLGTGRRAVQPPQPVEDDQMTFKIRTPGQQEEPAAAAPAAVAPQVERPPPMSDEEAAQAAWIASAPPKVAPVAAPVAAVAPQVEPPPPMSAEVEVPPPVSAEEAAFAAVAANLKATPKAAPVAAVAPQVEPPPAHLG